MSNPQMRRLFSRWLYCLAASNAMKTGDDDNVQNKTPLDVSIKI